MQIFKSNEFRRMFFRCWQYVFKSERKDSPTIFSFEEAIENLFALHFFLLLLVKRPSLKLLFITFRYFSLLDLLVGLLYPLHLMVIIYSIKYNMISLFYLKLSGISPPFNWTGGPPGTVSDRFPLVHPLEYWNVCAVQGSNAMIDISTMMMQTVVFIISSFTAIFFYINIIDSFLLVLVAFFIPADKA